jgi:hypothetical protein
MISCRPATKDFWSKLVQSTNAKSAVLDSTDVIQTGDGAVEIGRATLTLHPDGVRRLRLEVKYVVYWRQEDGLRKAHRYLESNF